MKIAAFTMVYNEPLMLPLWARHYGQQFGAENLFLLDHGSDDGSTAGLVANTIRLPRGTFDEGKRCAAISAFQATLLGYYDAVVFSDCDEFLVADPARYAGLGAFVAERCPRYATAMGFNVLQVQGVEPPIDWSRPVLAQRDFAIFERHYSKTLVSRVPIRWRPGFHISSEEPKFERDLYLFHLKFIDHATFMDAQAKRRSVEWAKESIANNHGGHWRRSAEVIASHSFLREAPTGCQPLDDPGLAARELSVPQTGGRRSGAIYTIPERFRDTIPGRAT